MYEVIEPFISMILYFKDYTTIFSFIMIQLILSTITIELFRISSKYSGGVHFGKKRAPRAVICILQYSYT